MEFPEIQVMTFDDERRNVPSSVNQDQIPESSEKVSISAARRRFIAAVYKVVIELAAERDRKIRQQELARRQEARLKGREEKENAETLPPLSSNVTGKTTVNHPVKRPPRNRTHTLSTSSETSVHNKHGASSGRTSRVDRPRHRIPDELPEIGNKSSEWPFGRRTGGMHLSSIVRLARFRKMMARRLNALRTPDHSDSDEDQEEELPSKPRFSATLSPEAQYAMMKGYEDILLDYLRPTEAQANQVLYRVKTPHERVISLKVTEIETPVKRTSRRNVQKQDRSYLSPDDAKDQSYKKRRSRLSECALTPPDENTDDMEDSERDKQIRLTLCFQKAMDIIDTIRASQGLPVTSPRERKLIRNPLKVYNKWSQIWSKEFKIQYA